MAGHEATTAVKDSVEIKQYHSNISGLRMYKLNSHTNSADCCQ